MTFMRLVVGGAGLVLVASGCEPPIHWEPPAPQGRTWQYEAQGAVRETRTFGGGAGNAGGGGFGYYVGDKSADVPLGTEPDKFWQQQAPGAFKFNSHLAGYGERVTPGAHGPKVGGAKARAAAVAPAPRKPGTPLPPAPPAAADEED